MRRAFSILVLVAASCAGPTTRDSIPTDNPAEGHYVRNIEMSRTRAEVGEPFRAEIRWDDNYITEPEIAVTGLPSGLRFDPDERAIVGTPERPGFVTVQVAIRKKVPDEPLHRAEIDDRWWPREIELEIYEPIE